MVKGEQPTAYVAPAQRISYDHTSRTFSVDQDGDLSPVTRTLSKLKSGSIIELNPRLNGHPESKVGIETGLVLNTQGTLIELPNLRRVLAKPYNDRERNRIKRKVNRIMLEVYRDLNPLAPLTRTTSCSFDETGVFRLTIDGVSLSANPNSYAVSINVPIIEKPDEERPTPKRPDIKTDLSFPIAYWHTSGSEAAVTSLLAGAGKLTSLVMRKPQSSPVFTEVVA